MGSGGRRLRRPRTRCPLPSYGGAGNEQPPAVRVLRRVTSSSQVVCALLLYLCRLWLRIDAGRACGLCNVSDTILPSRRVATVAKALRESPWRNFPRPPQRAVSGLSFVPRRADAYFREPLLYPLSYGGSRASVAPAANTLACSSESRSPAGCRTRTRSLSARRRAVVVRASGERRSVTLRASGLALASAVHR